MNDWIAMLRDRLRNEGAVVRVVVASVLGSAPREAGACMLVGERDEKVMLSGSIGGGHLEWRAIGVARCMLASGGATASRFDRMTLGASLGQCCGGAVELWFERYDKQDREWVEEAYEASRAGAIGMETRIIPGTTGRPSRRLLPVLPDPTPRIIMSVMNEQNGALLRERIDPVGAPLWLFGAGHVGRALVNVLATLPFRITWVDSREAQFCDPDALPFSVTALVADDPAAEVVDAPPNTHFLVMTHSHDLDDDICRAIMDRGDFAWAGLIGSRSKAARFVHRWERQGYRADQIRRFTCPIGLPGISGKSPEAIAVAVAAQLLQVLEAGCGPDENLGSLNAMPTGEQLTLAVH